MAITKDTLQIELTTTGDGKVKATLAGVSRELGAVDQNVGKVTAAFSGLKGVIAGIGIGAFAKYVVDSARELERLQASLVTVTGSATNAAQALDFIKQFTSTTPFQLNQVADAFIKLQALGIEPTAELLRSLGNTSSALGKDLDQSVEALADAITGEFERLKEFGIRASQQGDQVSFTFRGVTTTVGKNAAEITAYLTKIGAVDFAGAMERQMDTLNGAFSNLGDAVFSLTTKLAAESGLTDAIKEATLALTAFINEANKTGQIQLFKESQVETFAKGFDRLQELQKEAEKLRRIASGGGSFFETTFEYSQVQAAEKLKANLAEQERIYQNLIKLQDTALTPPKPPEAPKTAPTGGGGGTGAPSKAELKALAEYQSRLKTLLDTLDPTAAATRDYLQAVADLDRAWLDGIISGEQHDALMLKLATDTDATTKATEALSQARQRATDYIKGLDPGSVYRDQIAEVQKLRDTFPELSDALAEVELDLQDKWDQIGQDAKDSADSTKDAWKDLGLTFSSAAEDAIVNFNNVRDVLHGLEQDVARIATRKLFTEPFGNFISNAASSFLPNLFGAATGADFIVPGTGGLDTKYLPVSSGERVQVTPPGQGSASGGTVNNFTWNISTPNIESFRPTMRQNILDARTMLAGGSA